MKKLILVHENYLNDISDFLKSWKNTAFIITVVGSTIISTLAIRKVYFKTLSDLVNEENKRENEKENRINFDKKQSKILNEKIKTRKTTSDINYSPSDFSAGLGLLLDNKKNTSEISNNKFSLSNYSLRNRSLKSRYLNSLASYQINFSVESPIELIIFSGEYLKKALKILEDVKNKKSVNNIEFLNELIEKTKSLIDLVQNYSKDNKIIKSDDAIITDNVSFDKPNSPEGSVSSCYSLTFYDVQPNIHFFKLYSNALENLNDFIIPRVNRSSLFNCEDLNEFYAKVNCLRNGFDKIFSNEKNCDFFTKIGEYILKILITQPKDQKECLKIYDDIIKFVMDSENKDILKEELKQRNILICNFYDLVIDYIILDSFEDLENPPSAIISVINHRWLGDTFKIKALQTVINIVLKHKRSKLKIENGFFNKFYNLLEKISPVLAWGFLGTDSDLKIKCNFIKQGIFEVVRDYFDFDRVRFTTLNDLVVDILTVTEIRYDDFQNKISIII